MTLAEDLEYVFITCGYVWKIGEELSIPTTQDIQQVLDHAKNILDAEPSGDVQLEVGRLLFKKRDNTIDVFIMLGEVNDD